MNIVIITTDELYHQYLCVELESRHNVLAVLHPQRRKTTGLQDREMRRDRLARYGWIHFLLWKLIRNRLYSPGWNEATAMATVERRYFVNVRRDYQARIAGKAHKVEDINSEEGIALLSSFEPDVVVASGGPIYSASVVNTSKLMLNYHTGISPLYNGAYTVYQTFANRQPAMTGGTLMRMSTVVDGGDILAHYLPAVAAGDDPVDLFMKAMIGGVELYNRFLTHLTQGKQFVGVAQGAPFRTYFESEWTAYQTLAIERYIKQNLCAKYARDAICQEYWHLEGGEMARAALKDFLVRLVYRE